MQIIYDGGVSRRSYARETEEEEPRESSTAGAARSEKDRKTGNFYAVDRQSILKLAVYAVLYAGGSDM